MTDITLIPTEELEKDLKDSKEDILVCSEALRIGITTYSSGSVKERLDCNKHFVSVITKELERRKVI